MYVESITLSRDEVGLSLAPERRRTRSQRGNMCWGAGLPSSGKLAEYVIRLIGLSVQM